MVAGGDHAAALMDFTDILKIYGPMAIGWIVAGYLIKFIMDRYDKDIDSRAKLASALEQLSNAVKDSSK